jgi:hypothetical protein
VAWLYKCSSRVKGISPISAWRCIKLPYSIACVGARQGQPANRVENPARNERVVAGVMYRCRTNLPIPWVSTHPAFPSTFARSTTDIQENRREWSRSTYRPRSRIRRNPVTGALRVIQLTKDPERDITTRLFLDARAQLVPKGKN